MKRLGMAVVAALVVLALSVPAAVASNSCENAAKYGWYSGYWNTQCLWDLLTGWI